MASMSPDHDPGILNNETSVLVDEAIRLNLRILTGMARYWSHGFSTLFLVTPEGAIDQHIHAPCDPVNRAMLDKLYQLSHIDMNEGRVKVIDKEVPELLTGDPVHHYHQMTAYDSPRGLTFIEQHAKHGDWEDFSVTVSPTTPTQTPTSDAANQ